jgi:large subunit ribosomal protein L29
MRADDIREMGSDDIVARVRELEEERFRLKFRSATEPLEDPLRLREIRRDVARMKTILTEREKGIQRASAAEAETGGKRAKGAKGKATKTARRPAKKGGTKTRSR